MGQAAMAKARLMGYARRADGQASEDRDALKEQRKRERQARKKNRKRR